VLSVRRMKSNPKELRNVAVFCTSVVLTHGAACLPPGSVGDLSIPLHYTLKVVEAECAITSVSIHHHRVTSEKYLDPHQLFCKNKGKESCHLSHVRVVYCVHGRLLYSIIFR
jgi:hypothetical protein